MEIEKQAKKRVMSEETKEMLKQKRKEKNMKLKELETKVVNQSPQVIEKPETQLSYPKKIKTNSYNEEIKNRLANLETLLMQNKNDIFEIKTRKEIKDRLKQKKVEVREEKQKSVDKEEVATVQKQINHINEEMERVDYSQLFY